MNWGNEKVFLKVKSVLETGDNKGYNEIMAIVKNDVIAHVKAKVPQQGQDDVLQEIYLSVIKYLVKYVEKFETLSCSKRNAWLSRIASSKINDYWRGYYKEYTSNNQQDNTSCRIVFTFGELKPKTDDDEESEFEVEYIDHDLDNVTSILPEDLPLGEIRMVCAQHTSPDRILAFLYQKYLFDKNKKAKPKKTVEMLSEYTLGELYSIFLNTMSYNKVVRLQMQNALKNLFSMLNQKDGEQYVFQQHFCLNTKQVTDSYYYINKKISH